MVWVPSWTVSHVVTPWSLPLVPSPFPKDPQGLPMGLPMGLPAPGPGTETSRHGGDPKQRHHDAVTVEAAIFFCPSDVTKMSPSDVTYEATATVNQLANQLTNHQPTS